MVNVIGAIMTAGVAILAIALIALVTGKTLVALPGFTGADDTSVAFNETMKTVAVNAGTAFNLLGISPLVLGAAVIISILLGAFVYTQTQ